MAVALNLRRADARDGQQLTRTARIALGDRFQGGVGEDGVCRRPAATGALAAPGAQLLEHRPVRGRRAAGMPADLLITGGDQCLFAHPAVGVEGGGAAAGAARGGARRLAEIGRAACRERVSVTVGGTSATTTPERHAEG